MELQPYKKDDTRFLLLEGVHKNAVEALEKAGYTNIEYIPHALDEDTLIEKIKGARFVGIRSRTQLTQKVLDAADRLTAIGCFCIGTNQVDLETAKMKGIPVFNAPYSNTRSVAELVIGQLILMLRGIRRKAGACTTAPGRNLLPMPTRHAAKRWVLSVTAVSGRSFLCWQKAWA